MKKKLLGIVGGTVLLIVVALSRIGPDVAPITSKGAKSTPTPTTMENPSSPSVQDLETLMPAVEMAGEAQSALASTDHPFDLSGYHSAIREENYREAVDKWYRENLAKAEENNLYRFRDFLKDPVTRFRIKKALDTKTYERDIFLPALESGEKIDLDATLLPVIAGLSKPEQKTIHANFKKLLDKRNSLLQKAAKYYAEEDGSPSIKEKHMDLARRAFEIRMREMKTK